MTPDEARTVLRQYKQGRANLPEAVRTLAPVMTQTQIASESGLSREGVRKILARQEPPMRTLTIDATAGAVQAVIADVFPGRLQPGIGGGRMAEVTLPEEDAETLAAELAARGYEYDVR
jgi:hypothetical protein